MLDPDAFIALGDLQYDKGSGADFAGSYAQSWGPLKSITRPLPGNHEYLTADAAGYFDYFDQPASWYAWDAAGWRIYMLNSNCAYADCAAEADWLEQDLSDNPTDCSAIAMHHPRYSSGLEHGSDARMSQFWHIAYAHHVDLALAGHDYDYERFQPMDADGTVQPGRGITSFVSGTGGKSLYHQGRPETGSEFFQASEFGVLDLRLSTDGFSWAFTGTDQSRLDQGSAPCA